MSKNSKWKAVHTVLNLTHDLSAREIHRRVRKSRGDISYSTIASWRRKVRNGETIHPRFETMQAVLIAMGYSFAVIDSVGKVHQSYNQKKKSRAPKWTPAFSVTL